MRASISDLEFEKLWKDEELFLPIRWEGRDFLQTLKRLFNSYIKKLDRLPAGGDMICVDSEEVERVCRALLDAVDCYLNGFPYKAYDAFREAMATLKENPLHVYKKTIDEQFSAGYDDYSGDDPLRLFRVVAVDGNGSHGRERVFHTPYDLRSKVSTTRYSIAGYPSLYLGTSLELCCEEAHIDPHRDHALASIFKLERSSIISDTDIRVIELGVKPQDFLGSRCTDERNKRKIERYLLISPEKRRAYLLWYPLIAACSYIRANKDDPFAAEYIVPQLLMQWVRNEIGAQQESKNKYKQLIGIRYFSCASEGASDIGFNYVFPTSGKQKSSSLPYCAVLAKSFYLSEPEYVHEYDHLCECEKFLRGKQDFAPIDGDKVQ